MKFLNLLLLLAISTSVFAQSNVTNKYYRHLRYNHVSPYISIVGIHAIDELSASSTSHYIFKYDESKQLIEIINNHYHTEKQHPLASIGAYKVVLKYEKGKEIRTFYDKNGTRIRNDRSVYKEVYSFDKGFKSSLMFYDLNDEPCESNWQITSYQWEKKAQLIIERRFNLKNEAVDVSPYFEFGITGISLNEKGAPTAHYNLNDNLEIIENTVGVASYQDLYDKNGNHIQYSYHNAKNDLVNNQWGFAIGQKIYDEIGNNIRIDRLDTNKKIIRTQKIYTNTTLEHSPKASQKDSIEIKKIALGYLIALQQLNPELIDTVLNDSLNKVTIGYNRDTRAEYARRTTKRQMLKFAATWNKANNKFPPKPNNQVIILDIYNRIATVKLISDNWVEYLQLIKLDGNWDIINLIWQHKDIGRYPK